MPLLKDVNSFLVKAEPVSKLNENKKDTLATRKPVQLQRITIKYKKEIKELHQ